MSDSGHYIQYQDDMCFLGIISFLKLNNFIATKIIYMTLLI